MDEDIRTSEQVVGGLLDTYHTMTLDMRKLREMIHLACLQNNIKKLTYNGMELTFQPTTNYDPAQLARLGEFFPPTEIESMKNKPTERTWNKTKLNKLVKQGGAIGAIIEEAKMETEPTVKIKLPPQA